MTFRMDLDFDGFDKCDKSMKFGKAGKLGKFARGFAPLVALALAGMTSGCDGSKVSINGEEGKPLSELDLSGAAPTELVLMGPDEVRITPGDKLAINVEGDAEAAEAMRFVLKDGALAVLREGRFSNKADGTAIVNVTMPAPTELVLLGSGTINAAGMASAAKVVVTGSGTIETPSLSSESLDLVIGGSGSHRAAGNVAKLDMMIGGSGSARFDALKVERAKVTLAGSGDATFASDGEVEATIMGSGEVRVRGRARCKVSAMGSGKLVCETAPETATSDPA